MKLYYSDVLSPHKACAVARYLKSPVEFVYLDLVKGEQQAPAYLVLNPNGKVPTLVDGERVVWEADAVRCYLAERAGSELWPPDSGRQIEVIRWLSWNAQHFYRHGGSLHFQHIIKPRFALGRVSLCPGSCGVFQCGETHDIGRRSWLVDDCLRIGGKPLNATAATLAV
jgi:glutathione S-transferase